MMVEGFAARQQRHQRRVRFDPVRRVIDLSGYCVHLDDAPNAVALLDWLVQITRKGWSSPQLLHDVVYELEDACQQVFGTSLQGVYCPGEEPRIVDWRRGVTRRARVVEVREDGNKTSRRGRKRTPAREGR